MPLSRAALILLVLLCYSWTTSVVHAQNVLSSSHTLPGTGHPKGHVLSLDGDGDYVHLPSDIFNHLDEATIEGWVRWEKFNVWDRFFDFGAREKSMNVTRQSV